MRFIFRFLVKVVMYFAVLLVFMEIRLLPEAPVISEFILALILAAVNTVLRPVFVALALAFNIVTFGIASVFANLLTLVIASAIAGGTATCGFWAMLLTAFVIMLCDDCARVLRRNMRLKRA